MAKAKQEYNSLATLMLLILKKNIYKFIGYRWLEYIELTYKWLKLGGSFGFLVSNSRFFVGSIHIFHSEVRYSVQTKDIPLAAGVTYDIYEALQRLANLSLGEG